MKLGRREEDVLAERRAAVARLFESHYERVVRYIAARIGDPTEAEDLASEVFLRAVRSVGSYKDTGAPMEAWIFRIAHNIIVDHFRKAGARKATVPIEEAVSIGESHDPNERLERHQEIERLRTAMGELTEDQRQVLSLRFAAEMTSEQAGEVMGKKAGAVREMQSAALRKLRRVLGPSG